LPKNIRAYLERNGIKPPKWEIFKLKQCTAN
jgi:hypothetical protein